MIVLNDEFNNDMKHGEHFDTSLNNLDIATTPPFSYQKWNKLENMNDVPDSGLNAMNLAETKKASFTPYFEKFPSNDYQGFSNTHSYNVDQTEPGELETITTQSDYRKTYQRDTEKLPIVLQHALKNDNSIIHYHEHEHIHKHKKVPSRLNKVQGRMRNNENGASLFHHDHNFESTKSYYHHREYPRNRTKNKPKHPSQTSDQEHLDYSDDSSSYENKYRDSFGLKKHYKYKRGDYYFQRPRRYPKWKKGKY